VGFSKKARFVEGQDWRYALSGLVRLLVTVRIHLKRDRALNDLFKGNSRGFMFSRIYSDAWAGAALELFAALRR